MAVGNNSRTISSIVLVIISTCPRVTLSRRVIVHKCSPKENIIFTIPDSFESY